MAVHVACQLFWFFLFVCDIRKLFLFPTLQLNSQQPHILTKFRQPKYTKIYTFLLQLKQKVLTYPAKESVYKKDDIVQINKVRSYVRKYDYLLYPFEETEHLSIDGKQVPHEDLVHFRSIHCYRKCKQSYSSTTFRRYYYFKTSV